MKTGTAKGLGILLGAVTLTGVVYALVKSKPAKAVTDIPASVAATHPETLSTPSTTVTVTPYAAKINSDDAKTVSSSTASIVNSALAAAAKAGASINPTVTTPDGTFIVNIGSGTIQKVDVVQPVPQTPEVAEVAAAAASAAATYNATVAAGQSTESSGVDYGAAHEDLIAAYQAANPGMSTYEADFQATVAANPGLAILTDPNTGYQWIGPAPG